MIFRILFYFKGENKGLKILEYVIGILIFLRREREEREKRYFFVKFLRGGV